MNDVIDCFADGVQICFHWNWRTVGEKLKGVCVQIVTLETTIVFQVWTNVPAFNAMVVPGPANLGLFVN